MKNNKEKKIKNKEQKKYDKGQVFVKIMAGILAIMMILSVAVSLIYSIAFTRNACLLSTSDALIRLSFRYWKYLSFRSELLISIYFVI